MKNLIILLVFCCTTFAVKAQLSAWQFKKALTITERSGEDLTSHQVLLHIDTKALIDAGQLLSDAADLRFATDCEGLNVVPHYIKKDTNSTDAFIWVLMDLAANSNTSLFMFYGNALATTTAAFDQVFLNNFILEIGAEINLQDTELDYDWFEIKAGTFFTLSPNHPGKIKINARRIIIDGDIIGDSHTTTGAFYG